MTRRGRLAPVPLLLRERVGFQSSAHLPAARSTGNLRVRENRPGGPSPGRPMRLIKLVRRPLRARPKREYGAPGGSFRPGGSPAALIRARRRGGARAAGRMGLLGRSGAGSCPNLLQRRPGPGSAPRRSAEYQRFASGTSTGSGPLQQIWTTRAAAGPRDEDAARLTATTTSTPTTRRAPDDRTGSAGTSRPRSDDGDAILTVGWGPRERRPAREDARPRPARAPWAARRRAPRRARSSLDPRERTPTREIVT